MITGIYVLLWMLTTDSIDRPNDVPLHTPTKRDSFGAVNRRWSATKDPTPMIQRRDWKDVLVPQVFLGQFPDPMVSAPFVFFCGLDVEVGC